MNAVDLVILGLVAIYAITGWVHGFVSNIFEGAGLIGGGILGIFAVPWLLSSLESGPTTALISIGIVALTAIIGQFIGRSIGRGLRVESGPGRVVDATAGSALGMVVVLAASWALGYAVTSTNVPYLSQAVRNSVVLERIDNVMPDQADDLLAGFSRTLAQDVFPRYIDPFSTEEIVAVEPPDEATLSLPGVQSAATSVVKITGMAPQCGRGIEGSGFVYSAGRVMTNAHVVAGVSSPYVLVGNDRYPARAVLFDPDLDIAVLDVPDLNLPALQFDTSGQPGDEAAVLGYPENGPFDARAARIRNVVNLSGPDIYNRNDVVRESFAVRSLVRSGNSGGPLVSTEGNVLGVIFAASLSDSSTGYAVTATQVAGQAAAGVVANSTVSTGDCL